MNAPDEIDAGPVLLRRWGRVDPEDHWRAVAESLDHVGPWMAWARPDYSADDAAAYLTDCDARWGTDFDYAVIAPGEAVAGSCSLMSRSGGVREIGYWLHPDHLGHGYATAAARSLVALAFETGARAVEIVHDEANPRSGGVPLRLGFMEVERRRTASPGGRAETGRDVVWRLRAP